jgi:hypothetical protein
MKLYRAVDVWERQDEHTVIKYRCFQSLSSGKYCVQSADFFRSGTQPRVSDDHYVELFLQQDPTERAGEYITLEEAIAAHKREFA